MLRRSCVIFLQPQKLCCRSTGTLKYVFCTVRFGLSMLDVGGKQWCSYISSQTHVIIAVFCSTGCGNKLWKHSKKHQINGTMMYFITNNYTLFYCGKPCFPWITLYFVEFHSYFQNRLDFYMKVTSEWDIEHTVKTNDMISKVFMQIIMHDMTSWTRFELNANVSMFSRYDVYHVALVC